MTVVNFNLNDPCHSELREAAHRLKRAVEQRLGDCGVRFKSLRANRIGNDRHIMVWIEFLGFQDSLARCGVTVSGHLMKGGSLGKFIRNSLRLFEDRLAEQVERGRIAKEAGIHRPLQGRDLTRLSHRWVDRDALDIVIRRHGSPEAALRWIEEQMPHAVHRKHLVNVTGQALPSKSKRPPVFIDLNGLQINFTFNLGSDKFIDVERSVKNSRHDSQPPRYTWTGDTIKMFVCLPISVSSSMVGKTVGEIIEGTPISNRRILDVQSFDDDASDSRIDLKIESNLVKLADVLPIVPGR